MAKKATGCKSQTAEIFFGTKIELEFTKMCTYTAFFPHEPMFLQLLVINWELQAPSYSWAINAHVHRLKFWPNHLFNHFGALFSLSFFLNNTTKQNFQNHKFTSHCLGFQTIQNFQVGDIVLSTKAKDGVECVCVEISSVVWCALWRAAWRSRIEAWDRLTQ